MYCFVKDTIEVYLFTFKNHDGDLVKYFDLVLTIPIHGYPYIYYRNRYMYIYCHGYEHLASSMFTMVSIISGGMVYVVRGLKSPNRPNFSPITMLFPHIVAPAEAMVMESGENLLPWTADEQKLLEQALRTYPAGTPERWDKIAACLPTRSKKDCMTRFKVL